MFISHKTGAKGLQYFWITLILKGFYTVMYP